MLTLTKLMHTRLRVATVTALSAAFLSLAPATSQAVTIRDIVELTKSGLSDDIIIALLEADPTIFSLDATRILELRRKGVSERVLIEMLRSGRERPNTISPNTHSMSEDFVAPEQMLPEPEEMPISDPVNAQQQNPAVVVIEHTQAPPAQYLYVPNAVYVPTGPMAPQTTVGVGQPGGFGRFANDGSAGRFINDGSAGRFINDGYRPPQQGVQAPAEPVYWGFGGQRRSDTWEEPKKNP